MTVPKYVTELLYKILAGLFRFAMLCGSYFIAAKLAEWMIRRQLKEYELEEVRAEFSNLPETHKILTGKTVDK